VKCEQWYWCGVVCYSSDVATGWQFVVIRQVKCQQRYWCGVVCYSWVGSDVATGWQFVVIRQVKCQHRAGVELPVTISVFASTDTTKT
jgi:hypothetical protein